MTDELEEAVKAHFLDMDLADVLRWGKVELVIKNGKIVLARVEQTFKINQA